MTAPDLPAFDYAAMLAKYIAHVRDCEGVSFISERRGFFYESDADFTEAEWVELNRIDQVVTEARLGTPESPATHEG